MEQWLYRLEHEWTQAHSVFLCVGIITLAFLVVLLLARAFQAMTGISVFNFGSRGNGRRPSDASNLIPGGHEKILIVDDEPVIREMTARLLTELGYRAVSVAGGEAAVAYMGSNGADLILLDLRMEPGLDGVETFRRIKELRSLQKAVVMTGQAVPAEIAAVRALGISHYLIKPVPIALLARVIREELDRP